MKTSPVQLLPFALVLIAVGWFAGSSVERPAAQAAQGRRYIEPRSPASAGTPFSGGVLVGGT
jgi:hypothetical protein